MKGKVGLETKGIKSSILLLLLVLICLVGQQAKATNAHSPMENANNALYFFAQPTVATVAEPIVLHAGGTWYRLCTPVYDSHIIRDDHVIEVYAVAPDPTVICIDDPLLPDYKWHFEVDLGTLPVGTYQTELYITHVGTALVATDTFFVFEQVFQDYLPVVYQSE